MANSSSSSLPHASGTRPDMSIGSDPQFYLVMASNRRKCCASLAKGARIRCPRRPTSEPHGRRTRPPRRPVSKPPPVLFSSNGVS
ncbi:hypothetical protein FOVSG1_007288 [Fusarium oxysporum f. sp. vasinfectum]